MKCAYRKQREDNVSEDRWEMGEVQRHFTWPASHWTAGPFAAPQGHQGPPPSDSGSYHHPHDLLWDLRTQCVHKILSTQTETTNVDTIKIENMLQLTYLWARSQSGPPLSPLWFEAVETEEHTHLWHRPVGNTNPEDKVAVLELH